MKSHVLPCKSFAITLHHCYFKGLFTRARVGSNPPQRGSPCPVRSLQVKYLQEFTRTQQQARVNTPRRVALLEGRVDPLRRAGFFLEFFHVKAGQLNPGFLSKLHFNSNCTVKAQSIPNTSFLHCVSCPNCSPSKLSCLGQSTSTRQKFKPDPIPSSSSPSSALYGLLGPSKQRDYENSSKFYTFIFQTAIKIIRAAESFLRPRDNTAK